MWQLTQEGLPLILSRSVCRFLKHQQFSAHLFLNCLIESSMCAWAAVLPLSVSLQSLLGSLDPCSRGGGGVAAFSVSNVRKPFPSSLETSSVGWFTQMSTWWNQIKYTLENDGPHCFSVSHPNNFIFPFFSTGCFLNGSVSALGHTCSLGSMALDSWGIQPSNYSRKTWIFFFPPAWLWAQMKHLHFNLHNVFSFRWLLRHEKTFL